MQYGLESAAAGACGDPRSMAELARIVEASGLDAGLRQSPIRGSQIAGFGTLSRSKDVRLKFKSQSPRQLGSADSRL